jgi:hypothetical protein
MGKEATFIKEMLLREINKKMAAVRQFHLSSFRLIINHNEPLKRGAKIEDSLEFNITYETCQQLQS